ncbi:Hpt domain-containing protein, partial [Klebsiella pneumoniae]
KRAYCLKIQPATGSFARNLIYSTKPISGQDWRLAQYHLHRINGTAQILGATAIHATAEQLENALAAGEPEAVLPQGIDELTQQLQALSAAIIFFSSQADYH